MKKKRILVLADITGHCPDYHVGDEAMAEVAINRLSKIVGRDNILLGTSNRDAIYRTYGVKSFTFYHTSNDQLRKILFTRPWSYVLSFFRIFLALLKTDIVFVCGGGNMTSVWPHVLESRLRLLKLADFLKKDIYLVSQTMGPFSELHRAEVEDVLKNAKWIGVRDKTFSMNQISLPVSFAVDDACFLEANYKFENYDILNSKRPYCCLSMRYFGAANDNNLNDLAATIARITNDENMNTIFIPHHAPGGNAGDVELANSISNLWGNDHSLFITNPIPLAGSLKALTSGSEWVVTMRYHQLIFALSTGVPSVGVFVNEYTEAKLRGAFEQFNIEPALVSIDEAKTKLEDLIAKVTANKKLFEDAAENLANYEETINLKPYKSIML